MLALASTGTVVLFGAIFYLLVFMK